EGAGPVIRGPILRLTPSQYHHRARQPHTPPMQEQEPRLSSQQPIRMPLYPTPLPDLIPVEFERRTLHTHTTTATHLMAPQLTYHRTLSNPTLPTHYQRIM
ncbi:hypothetical protein FHG87_013028, partial [Trinorchestia longiramus]